MNSQFIYIRAFVAGLVFPATVSPILYLVYYLFGPPSVRTVPLQFLPLYISIVFGLWNVGYFLIGNRCPVKKKGPRLFVSGASLGLMIAIIGVFVIRLPVLLFGFSGFLEYLPLIVVPIFYGVVWRYFVRYLNDLLGLLDP